MLAANLIDKLIGLAKYANNSIETINGVNHKGVPDGTKTLKNFKPCFKNAAITITKNNKVAKANVTIIC